MARWLKYFFMGIFTGLLGVTIYLSPSGLWLEERFGLSALFQLRGAIKAPDEVVVVALDQQSAEQLKLHVKPRLWPRSMHARLIDQLAAAGASTIIFDLIFDTPSDIPEQDEELANAIKRAGNVLLVERLDYQDSASLNQPDGISYQAFIQEGTTQLLPIIGEAAKARAPFTLPKAERVHHYWTFKSYAGDIATVPVVVLQIYAGGLYGDFVRLLDSVEPGLSTQLPTRIDETDIEDLILTLRNRFTGNPQLASKMKENLDRDRSLKPEERKILRSLLDVYAGDQIRYLNFYGPPRSITTIPYYQALQADRKNLEGKVVFVGFSGATQSEQEIVRDDYPTVFSNPDGLYISGVEIAATAFANLLENKPVRPLSLTGNLSILFLLGFAIGMAVQVLSTRKTIVLSLSVILVHTFIAYSFFKHALIWLPVIIPALLVLIALMLSWGLKILKLEGFMGKSGPAQELDQIIEEQAGRFSGACLTTDIEGYTTLSESMSPSTLEKLMADYRVVLRNAVDQHYGRVMDTTGDSSLSIWIKKPENPVTQKFFSWIKKPSSSTEKLNVCKAALDLSAAIERFNKLHNPPLPTRIGLHFGDMSLNKSEGTYRVTGDVVNTTDRIQNANKILKTRILLSSDVIEELDDFLVRPLGSFQLPGRTKSVALFELIAYRQSASRQQLWLYEIFIKALNAYQLKQWTEANQYFYDILREFPTDGPTHYFLSLCSKYQNESSS
ncbi:MAG TPA: adenylate/guanylate cyclase domain-containing protein [Nitrosomonas sp.]|nr:adenylate/guanylate cyclase domain-containing protein [Nitrosomonas sp.]HRB21629.1 adenylate/guanylate cyclase domain-containing protein [Nitrosomonas sp.]HRB32611.1 adenylate/guanylate cyclase domain-containing protein [Nitrosomonas sp.]HRB45879.1 adenylate/guanylate cyclase domain-containing protein [Nitrosomonas sp.]HRB77773.1 adenylate/guanylate cyclase domain-containing protein [Nitrosomonas sp.]